MWTALALRLRGRRRSLAEPTVSMTMAAFNNALHLGARAPRTHTRVRTPHERHLRRPKSGSFPGKTCKHIIKGKNDCRVCLHTLTGQGKRFVGFDKPGRNFPQSHTNLHFLALVVLLSNLWSDLI